MQRIDVHSHFIPEIYRAALEMNDLMRPDGIAVMPAWSVEKALETMDRLGIRTAFLSISSPGVHFGDDEAAVQLARQVNEEAARLVKVHPGRFGFFASTPLPNVELAVAELRYAFDHLAADGIVLTTNFKGVYLGNGVLDPIYAELNERHATVFIHPTSPHCPCSRVAQQEEPASSVALGYPRPMLEFMFETTRSVTNLILAGVLERYPHIEFIVPHAGAALPVLAARVELLLPMLSVADAPPPPSLRTALRKLHFDLAGAPVPELLSSLLQVADLGHIHYGSDWPFTPAPICEKLLSALDTTALLDDAARSRIMSENALNLFPRLSPTSSGRS
jgi:predicted TIM-barrel fold metal-dependent hydrolase